MAELQQTKSLVETYREYSPTDITIRPYFDPEVENMGLEKYGQVFFEGTGMLQSLRCREANGVVRYTTNLDEFALEIKRLPEDQQKARIKEIRETVSKLNEEIFAVKVPTNDKDFWAKVELRPTNEEFWKTVQIAVGNQPLYLDPRKPEDLIVIIAAEGGGFDDIAPSLEDAKKMVKPPKFYLEKRRDVRINEGKLKISRDNAIYELYKIRMEQPQRLFLLAKNILPIANSYRKTDKIEILYGELSDFIEGISIEKNKKKAPVTFKNYVEKSDEYLTVRAYVLEAIFLKHFVTKSDNKIYIRETGSMLGGNIEECIEHLKNPMNQNDLNFVEEKIESIWSK